LRRHSPSEVDAAIVYFADRWDVQAERLTSPLTAEEQAFITNERILCALDFDYWLNRYAWIVNYEKKPTRFTANVAQAIVMELWAERERAGLAIWMQQLKARRLGVSTISELAVQHRFQFVENTAAVIASSTPEKSWDLAGMIKYSLNQQPWWLLPQGTPKITNGMPSAYPDLNSSLTIQAGNQYKGVGRGATPNVIHLSELMEWEAAEDLIDGALMRAIVDTPNVFGILESTGGVYGGWWHRTWEQTKRDFARGRSRMIPVFLPWYVGTDLYPSAADLRARPIPGDWIPSDKTIEHAERARKYVTTNPLLFKHLAKHDPNWKLSRAQLWFREMEYETAKEKKQLHIFRQELCADDFESFQSSNIPIIDPEILMTYQERTRDPIAVYTVFGPEIHNQFTVAPRHWLADAAPQIIRTRNVLATHDYVYQLQPLQFDGYPGFDPDLKLLVWEFPREGHTYGIGLDCGEGIGQDRTCIQVLREATPFEPPMQVAEWVSDRTTAFQAWPFCLAVATWYSMYSPVANRVVQARVAIEAFTNGASAQNEIQKRGWVNFHPWQYNDTRKKKSEGSTQRIGVYTNQWFRASMQDMFLTALSEEAIDLPSPYLVQELVTLEREPGTKKAVAAAGSHDDRFMSLGFPLFSLHQNKPPSKQFPRKKVAYAPALQEQTGERHPVWQAPAVALASAWRGNSHAPVQRIVARGLRAHGGLGRPGWR
jgi:hypothetical protein